MRKNINKKTICLAAAAVVLSASIGVGSAMAYFTTYAVAEGGYQIHLGFTETDIEEEVVNGRKEVQIKNTGGYDCYIRMKALTGDAYKAGLTYSEPDGAGKWTPGADGYYYYSDIVSPNETTSQINVGFKFPEGQADSFNVIIIQECTVVRYNENGEAYVDWDEVANISESVVVE